MNTYKMAQDTDRKPFRIITRLTVWNAVIFLAAGVLIVWLVNHAMRREAVREAEAKSRMLIDRNLATHRYFHRHLKPAVFKKLSLLPESEDFDPVWMSSTFAIRKMNHYQKIFSDTSCNYKECAVNARDPGNEADETERAFINALNADDRLIRRSLIRNLDGVPYFVFLRRGEVMEKSCLRCHDRPETAPEELVKIYGRKAGFFRREGETVSAISVRIPLEAAFSQADAFSLTLSAAVFLAFVLLFFTELFLLNRLMFRPLSIVRKKALRMSGNHQYLGEVIMLDAGGELTELADGFNAMSLALRESLDRMEDCVRQRTSELMTVNRNLKLEVTERKRTEDYLRESEENYRTLVNTMDSGLVMADREDRFLIANEKFCKMTGYGIQELQGMPLISLFDAEHRAVFEKQPLCEMDRGKEACEIRLRRKNGHFLYVSISPSFLRDEHDAYKGVLAVVTDMTERKKMENRLRSEHEKLNGVLNSIGALMCIVNGEQEIEFQNRAFTNRFGDRAGVKCFDVIPCNGDICGNGGNGPGEHTSERQYEIEFPDGACYHVVSSPFADADGEMKSILLMQDITEKKKLEAETVRAGRLASLGELAAGVAHEINNPINGIISMSEILKDDFADAGLDMQIPDRIIRESSRIAGIVKNLLSFSRNRKEVFTDENPCEILSDSLVLLERQMRKDGTGITVGCPEDLPDIRVRGTEIQQVFLNILANAWYALNEKYRHPHPDKTITITASPVQLENRQYVRFEFYDQGTGMAPDVLKNADTPFFSTKPGEEGTGLGLSISHGIIDAHNGHLTLESEEGRYSRIVVDLPTSENREPAAGGNFV